MKHTVIITAAGLPFYKPASLNGDSHPFDCLCFALARCFMTHASGYITRNSLDIIITFAVTAEEGEITHLSADFSGSLDEKEKKVLVNIVKTCPIWDILRHSCRELPEYRFSEYLF